MVKLIKDAGKCAYVRQMAQQKQTIAIDYFIFKFMVQKICMFFIHYLMRNIYIRQEELSHLLHA